MRASRIPIALSAFVLGILVAQGASWLLHVGEPTSAFAGQLEPLSQPLPLAGTDQTHVNPDSNAVSSTSTGAAGDPSQDSANPEAKVRTAVSAEAQLVEVNLNSMIAQLYEESPEDFLEMLVDKLLEDGQPMRALELLRESPDVNSYLFSRVGNALRKDGQVAAAIEAFTESTRLNPMESESFEPLMELDPSTALMVIQDGLAWQPPPGNAEMRIRLANALLAAGQEDEAKKLVEELRAAGIKNNSLSTLFNQLSPEEAEAEMRGTVETAVGKKKIRPMQKLAAMLQASGRNEEARAVIESLLELNPGDTRARRMLAKVDTEAYLELLENRTQSNPKASNLWTEYGNALHEQGRRVDAISAWEQSLSQSGSNAAFKKLLEESPSTAWNSLEAYTQSSNNDERWGDFGDLLWQNDRQGDAKRAWEKAWELDPNDSEWYGKLQAIQVGRAPLN